MMVFTKVWLLVITLNGSVEEKQQFVTYQSCRGTGEAIVKASTAKNKYQYTCSMRIIGVNE